MGGLISKGDFFQEKKYWYGFFIYLVFYKLLVIS